MHALTRAPKRLIRSLARKALLFSPIYSADVPEGQANSEEYRPINWGWQEFPYTDAEWNALYSMEGFGAQTDLLANYDEVQYQPLMLGYSILKVDDELWLVNMNSINDEQAIWSIYVIEPEKEGITW